MAQFNNTATRASDFIKCSKELELNLFSSISIHSYFQSTKSQHRMFHGTLNSVERLRSHNIIEKPNSTHS